MTDTPPRPHAILLATDMGARTDRALDRALMLAAQWQARLVLLTVAPDGTPFSRDNRFRDQDDAEDAEVDPRLLLEARIRAELPASEVPVDIRVERGHVGEAAARVAAETGCGLIVTGIARSDVHGQMALGSAVVWLSRHAPVPVLVVQRRPRQPYRRIGVATDSSAPAAAALRLACQWFSDADALWLLHGYDLPAGALVGDDAERAATLQRAAADADGALLAHLDEAGLPDACRQRVQPQAVLANPVRLLRRASEDAPLDLAVLASHGRGRLQDMLVGSVATRLLETAVTDTLLVRR